MDCVALCELARGGSAEQLARVLDDVGAEDARRLVQQRPRRGPYKGVHAMFVAAQHNESVAVMQLLLDAARFDSNGLLLAMHMAEKNNNAAVAQVLARAEMSLAHSGSDGSARPGSAFHEGLSKKSFRTYSKLYRDPAAFDVLETEVLWELGKWALQRSAGRRDTIEVWSCGCSAGEEVFSVLSSWEQAVRPRLAQHETDVDLRCLGTDLSAEAIAAARRAEYGSHAVQDVPRATLKECFQTGTLENEVSSSLAQEPLCRDSIYRVVDRLKRQATFIQQDVRHELPKCTEDNRFDLVLCRYSVFLYCSRDECIQFLRQLVENLLRPSGFLFIGAPDELPACWQSLGLKEWRGHRGFFRLGDDPPPCANFVSAYPQFSAKSLVEFIGKPRPAAECIGCHEDAVGPTMQTEKQIKERLLRFEQWEVSKRLHVEQLQADRDKQRTEMRKQVYLSDSEHQQFVRRMQSEATRRQEALNEMQAELKKKNRKRQQKRKSGARRPVPKTRDKDTAVLHAKVQTAIWLERRNRAPRRAPAFGGQGRAGAQAGTTGLIREDSDATVRQSSPTSRPTSGLQPRKRRPHSGGCVRARTRPSSRAEMLMYVRHKQAQNTTALPYHQRQKENVVQQAELRTDLEPKEHGRDERDDDHNCDALAHCQKDPADHSQSGVPEDRQAEVGQQPHCAPEHQHQLQEQLSASQHPPQNSELRTEVQNALANTTTWGNEFCFPYSQKFLGWTKVQAKIRAGSSKVKQTASQEEPNQPIRPQSARRPKTQQQHDERKLRRPTSASPAVFGSRRGPVSRLSGVRMVSLSDENRNCVMVHSRSAGGGFYRQPARIQRRQQRR